MSNLLIGRQRSRVIAGTWTAAAVAASLLAGAVLSDARIAVAAELTQPVLLGGPELVSGIPGKGPLKLDDVKKWLADTANHQVLEVALPQGLAAGQSAMWIPEDNPLTKAKIELGRQLYFDPRLSVDSTISCASCHSPDFGFGKNTKFGVGVRGQQGGRNSPVSYNRILSKAQFWDGRADSLEAQAVGPIQNPIEMGFTHDGVVARLKTIPAYQAQFDAVFPGSGVNIDNVGKAIAAFERVIVTGPSPADYYEPLRAFREGFKDELADLEAFKKDDPESYEQYQGLMAASEKHPMSDAAKRGRELFFSERVGCTACHVGANFTDEKYHNLGVGMNQPKPDLGRYDETKQEKDKGAFKTPTIRNVALTGPYMHDGSEATLEDVVKLYEKGGIANPYLSDKVKKFELTDQERTDLVAYMRSLTGKFPPIQTARLPE